MPNDSAPLSRPSAPRKALTISDLQQPFQAGEKGSDGVQLLGTESEKFGVMATTAAPLSYEGKKCGVLGFFEALQLADPRWHGVRERDDGPLIALERGEGLAKQQVSLEPGAQFELSGAALPDVHAVADELDTHLEEIRPSAEECGVTWLSVGYHPLANAVDLPWVPKDRYTIMKEYFPQVGSRGLDMMRRTATIQVNVDFNDEADAMRKLIVGLKLGPVATAMFASSPFAAGALNGLRSERAAVWLDTDNNRCGLIPGLTEHASPSYENYVAWALDVPMYMFKREGRVIANTGQTFRSFMDDGFEGPGRAQHTATMGDWVSHLNTLFPEARLQRTIELRCTDALPRRYSTAVPALWAGMLYDDRSLQAAVELAATIDADSLAATRVDIARLGLAASVQDRQGVARPLRDIAMQMLELASEGLARRGRKNADGEDERIHLGAITVLTEKGHCPADEMLEGIEDEPDLRAAILERTRM